MKLLLTLLCSLLMAESWALYSDGIPYPFYHIQTLGQNQMMVIENGLEALELRLQMIRRAKKSIVAEYFIYNTDLAAKMVTRELVAAAQRGVKVRLLIDKSKPVFEFNEHYAKELRRYGIIVRYYNNAPLLRISTVQFRNHRKLLAIDDFEALTGGRNIGSDYFDLSEEFNFNDLDMYVKGPIVKTMRASFDQYFDHPISERPNLKKVKFDSLQSLEARAFLAPSAEEIVLKEKVAKIGGELLAKEKLHTCPITTFSTDAPGANFFARLNPYFDEDYKFLRKTLYDKIEPVDRQILISSPYMISTKQSRELLGMLLAKNVKIELYTNSLASTDAVYVAANLYLSLKEWANLGIDVYLHSGNWLGESDEVSDKIKKARWGTHTKAQVYYTSQYSEVMVGTYNVDHRSNFYNSEMAVFCRGNDELTEEVSANIRGRINKGLKVNHDGRSATDRQGHVRSIYGSSEEQLLKMHLITLPSWLLKFLL